MEEDQDIFLNGKPAVIEADLRDDYFWKLVGDFVGPRTGEGLDLDKAPCKNRLLIQVGLMREDNHISWSAVVKWLQSIFPKHQTADFRCLIETGIATTLSLGSVARQTFLESEVNFNFVGPICDSIGVERADLLERRDFSERAKSIEVTNGLILELSNFVTRENIDPINLVAWLRNFNPVFCKDGNIRKAYKVLRSKIKRLKLHNLNSETRSYRRNTVMGDLLHSPFELVPYKVEERRLVAKKRVKNPTLQKYGKVKKEELDEQEIMQDEEKSFLHLKSYKKKTVVKQENVSSDESDPDVDVESNDTEESPDNVQETLTLLEVAMLSVQKLTSVYGGKTDASKQVSMDLLKNLYAQTCKEHPAMLQFDKKITSLNTDSLASPLVFLHCNAHFLVDVHNAVEQQLLSFEKELTKSAGKKLGRDNNPKFKKFKSFSESATSRYIHMACDILSPHAPAEQNYRKHWEAFCKEMKNPSKLSVDLSNQLTKYFEAAAGLIHHYKEVGPFFSDLLLLETDDCPNIILESITDDGADGVIQSLVCVVAIIYCKILGPYWQLLESGGEYVLFSQYILCLYQKLLEFSKDPSLLLEPELAVNAFLQFPLQEKRFDRVFQFCRQWHINRELIRGCLQKMVKAIAAVMDENLMDFLPGGIYSQSPPSQVCSQAASCTFAVLMGKYPSTHSPPNKTKIPDTASKHSSTGSSSSSSSSITSQEDSPPSDSSGDASGESAHWPHKGHDKEKVEEVPGRRKPNKIQRVAENYERKFILATVGKNGGPCKTQQDVDKLLLRCDGKSRAATREALCCEILYQKMVLDNTDPNLDDTLCTNSQLANKLKLSLPRVKPGYSFVLAPKLTKPKPAPAPAEAEPGQ